MEKKQCYYYEEKELKAKNGLAILILNIILMILSIVAISVGITLCASKLPHYYIFLGVMLLIFGTLYLCVIDIIIFLGIKILKPNEALVLTLFGKYVGTLKEEGIFFVNPFCSAINPASESKQESSISTEVGNTGSVSVRTSKKMSKKISLKTMTLNNEKQKINDQLGNPIIIGIAVTWKITNTAKAVFHVDNYQEFLSIQCDSALRDIVRLYPYDVAEGGDEKSLRGSSQEIAENLKKEIQQRVEIAGLTILEARITHLAYAPEIAAVMLQRQQASAIIDARKMIVEGAVGMVEMAISKLGEQNIVDLDEERKAQMVSNLLVVLCSNKDTQPVVNSGSIY